MKALIVGVGPDGRIAYCPDASPAANSAGLPGESWIGHFVWDTGHPSQALKIRTAFAECLLTGKTQWTESVSEFGGTVEHWRSRYERVTQPVAVIVHAQLLEEVDDRSLTQRERQIARMVRDDNTIAQIAETLRLTESTVTTHLSNIRTKLGVQTNAGIAVWAVRAGL